MAFAILRKLFYPVTTLFENPWDNKDKNKKNKDDVPPEIEEIEKILRKGQKKIIQIISFGKDGSERVYGGSGGDNKEPTFPKAGVYALLLVALLGWLSTGFYTVQPDEVGVVLRFGKYERTSIPGLNYKFPTPLETVTKVSVTRINKEEIGFRSAMPIPASAFTRTIKTRDKTNYKNLPKESQMLTGDENIVDVDFDVQWRIKDAKAFLFNVRDLAGENTVKMSAESAMREVVGVSRINDILASQRNKIELAARELLQNMLDNYNMGVEVVRLQMLRVEPPPEVIDAYRDVQSAKADKEREINEAETYKNDILPRARGEAAKIVKGAEAYRDQIVAKATGDASKLTAVLTEYRKTRDVAKRKLYLEAMEEILEGMNKVIVDDNISNNMIPLLSLNKMNKITEGE
jgi:membrane protease subunit HflK